MDPPPEGLSHSVCSGKVAASWSQGGRVAAVEGCYSCYLPLPANRSLFFLPGPGPAPQPLAPPCPGPLPFPQGRRSLRGFPLPSFRLSAEEGVGPRPCPGRQGSTSPATDVAGRRRCQIEHTKFLLPPLCSARKVAAIMLLMAMARRARAGSRPVGGGRCTARDDVTHFGIPTPAECPNCSSHHACRISAPVIRI